MYNHHHLPCVTIYLLKLTVDLSSVVGVTQADGPTHQPGHTLHFAFCSDQVYGDLRGGGHTVLLSWTDYFGSAVGLHNGGNVLRLMDLNGLLSALGAFSTPGNIASNSGKALLPPYGIRI